MVRSAAIAAALLVVAGASNAFASVGGQTYIIDIRASASGDIKARMEFVAGLLGDNGRVGIDIENAGDYTGVYTGGAVGTVTPYNVASIAPDDGFFSALTGVAIDLKQAGGGLGAIATLLGIPGATVGGGFSTSGDLFFFTGQELLP